MFALVGSMQAYAAEITCERIVVTGNQQSPPYLWEDPADPTKLIGASVELLQRALEDSGIQVEMLNAGSWEKAQEEVRSGRVDMLAGAFLTPERLAYMDFVHPAYLEVPSVIFVRRGQAFPYNGWDDLRDKVGITLAGNSFGTAFDTFARDHLRLERVSSVDQALRNLLLGRADYVVYERFQGMALAEQLGLAGEIDVLDGSMINEQLYFTISHNSACNSPALRSALAISMQEMVSRGEPRQLLEKYRQQWASQFLPVEPENKIEPAVIE
ncbi:MAG TPA: transporter substrate-binding domain-containing protein [Pseudomonas xinjiangensis]|uniref:Transporter substrate-binding domain-containing protein n=2 Tax=root TaxID=1 RepID=A0A7V1BKH3_9GAMM|nr:transporter substrate-binding domain-containing protein [Halopseudomonas xinjiangensis]HEC47113.1 transporter substrate-binding domain-containing protein [Halopseudomonas xinjiangensis]